MTDQPDPVIEEQEAIKRIALSPDGALLHRHLRRVLETVIETPDTGALLLHTGRRSLARDLMRLMAEGVESAGRHQPGNDAVLVRGSRPVDTRPGHRAGQRRVKLEPGDGWHKYPAGADAA